MLRAKLDTMIRYGTLTILGPRGVMARAGTGAANEPEVVVQVRNRLAGLKVVFAPDPALGNAYMNGDLVMKRGSIRDLLDLCGRNLTGYPASYGHLARFGQRLRDRLRGLSHRAARQNVAHHYDLSEDLYRWFLDDDMQYSCGYFATPGVTLDAAQRAKKRHIAAKLLLAPGQRVLDIGSGWGGLAITIAQSCDVRVHGITLSQEQLQVARRRVADLGLERRVTFELQDYRDLDGCFDRVVSVGMLEHVGRTRYNEYFATLERLLAPDGIALIHSIGRSHGPSATSSWIRRWIFPGGYIPALSEIVPAFERSRLWLTDLEILRLHYAETLWRWQERFAAQRARFAALYDERFCRMWEFYLAASEMGFRYWDQMVFQAQLARRVDTVPMTRDYMVEAERGMRAPGGHTRQDADALLA